MIQRSKTEPQPWPAYQNQDMIQYTGVCCPYIVSTPSALLPFQIISSGAFVSAEICEYGSGGWAPIAISVTEETIGIFNVISYDGSDLAAELDPGVYEFRVNAGETWYFEPIQICDFTDAITDYTRADLLFLPLKFTENEFFLTDEPLSTIMRSIADHSNVHYALIGPSDGFLPFMFVIDHPNTNAKIYLLDCEGNQTELVGFPLTIETHNNLTYYIYNGEAYAFAENMCGVYRLMIEDGIYKYYSVPFIACDLTAEDSGVVYTADSTIITADDALITADSE